MLNTQLLLVLAGLAFLFLTAKKWITRRHTNQTLPPSPPPLPLLGNLHIFPTKDVHYQFTKWARQYGEIYTLYLGPTTAIVLTSPLAIQQILEKNSALTSDRPDNYIARLVTGDDHNLVLAHYTDTWRSLRRGAHGILTAQACLDHLAIQQAEAVQLSHDLLTDPGGFATSIRRYSFSVIMSVLYGKRVPRYASPEATALFKMLELWVNILSPGAHPLIEMFPALRCIPGPFASWRRLCKKVRIIQRQLYFGLLDEVEARSDQGNGNGCFMETVCARAQEWGLDRELTGYLGGVLIEAGSDTTSAFIQTLVLLLVAHPQVQRKAQVELDAVVGTDRMPILEDLEDLPYVRAVILETHRYRPVAPLAVPHAATAGFNYGQYTIPKGAILFVNTYGVFHDETIFKDPETYNPSRFLENPEKEKLLDLAFGAGRRVCPGMNLARNSIAINTMNLLWGFDFMKARDATGAMIEPDVWDYSEGVATCPNPFKCDINPRSRHHEEIVRRDFIASRDAFLPFEHNLSASDKAFIREQWKD
uniref:Cytochrome P450 n=1 Tax=Rhodonia placenta TaxID=104341 RepID=F1SYD8_9APHY|nr:cytochrome P450 [Postia placenta]